jgi:hypothetical protein
MSAPGEQGQFLSHLKDSFTSIYLTVLSIVQGVALTSLAVVVADGYSEFTPVQWALVFLTFLILIIVWNHVTTDAMTWTWIPDFRDSAIPFLLGAFELYQTFALVAGLGPWLFGMAAGATFAVLEFFHVGRQVRLGTPNAEMLRLFRRRGLADLLQGIVGIGVFLVLGAAIVVIEDAGAVLRWVAVLIAALWLGAYVLRTTVYWRALVALAHSGKLPAGTALSRLVGLPLR